MALTPAAVKRSTDATGDDILTFATLASKLVQGVALVDDAGAQVVEFAVCDLAEAGALTYVGKESAAGAWLVQRIDATIGLVVRYASVVNNATVTTYAAAWTARATTLVYGTYAEAF